MIESITWTQDAKQWAESASDKLAAAMTVLLKSQSEELTCRDHLVEGALALMDDAQCLLDDSLKSLDRAEKENRGEYIHLGGAA